MKVREPFCCHLRADIARIAHIIRRMTTKLFKAMKKLRSKSRWCLTGTPVQNSVQDLAALVSFIRLPSLDDLHSFRKHIVRPLLNRSELGVDNLRQLLDSICLRRTKELLELPELISECRLLSFSAKEEERYVETREKLINMISKNCLEPKHKKKNLGVFQLQLLLRRFCNHGTFQRLSLSDEFDPEQALTLLKKQNEAACEFCKSQISGLHGVEELRSGKFTSCGHLLCMKCVPKMKEALRPVQPAGGLVRCSLCSENILGEYILSEEPASQKSKAGRKHMSPWQYFDKNGYSTKMLAVVADLENNKTEGKG